MNNIESSKEELLAELQELKIAYQNDIAERNLTEMALRETEVRMSTITESVKDAILMMDDLGIISFWNPAAEKIFGYTSTEATKKNLHDLIVPQRFHPAHHAAFPEFQKTGKGAAIGKTIEVSAITKSGLEIEVELSLSSVRINEKWHSVGIVRDISERKLAKAEADAAYEKSIYLEKKIKSFKRTPPWQIILIFGLSIFITELLEMLLVHLLNITDTWAVMLLDSSVMLVIIIPILYHYLHKPMIAHILAKEAAEEEQNRLIDSLNQANEIIEVNSLQKSVVIEELTEAKLILAQINAEKDKFFSLLAHDLRSPFGGFVSLTGMMTDHLDGMEMKDIKLSIQAMFNSATNSFKLLENLLSWSLVQGGLSNFDPKPHNFLSIIRQDLIIELEMAKQKDIELNISIPEEIEIIADYQMMNTILRNLVLNAIKFTRRGGEIELGMVKPTADAEISADCFYVKDNGIGMDADRLGKLFKPGEKVKRPGTEKELSTGLGLLLCKEFIVKHGGKIWAESEVDKGTTFYFTLQK
jgi:PAS domain S-box-containing protein